MSENGFSLRAIGERVRRPLHPPPKQAMRLPQWLQGVSAWMKKRGGKPLLRDATLASISIILCYGAFLWLTLPDISDPRNLIASQSSVIVDRNGVELYRLYQEEDRTFVPADAIPDHMRHAIVAIEDERFYDRGCLDVIALARAVLRFGKSGGASTLTRQLARNALDLKHENILNRKLKELVLGCQLESQYSKEDLLNLYLNWIPFGQNAYGIEQASHTYFGIPANNLTLAQSAILAALPQRPSYFSPFGQHLYTHVSAGAQKKIIAGTITKASDIGDEDIVAGLLGTHAGTGATTVYVGGRTDQVLRNMQNQDFISEAERLTALSELETVTFQRLRESIRAPHFVLWVKQQVEEMIGTESEAGILDQGGITIETTIDWNLQQAAEKVLSAHQEDLRRYDIYNGAFVAADPATGEILTYVGNIDYSDEKHDGKVDMARAPRQPGSSFKPFVYAAAFEKGYGPATVLYDVPTKIGDDQPQNFDGSFWGLMTARRALGASRNIPAAKAFFLAGGESAVLDMAHRLGVRTPLKTKSEIVRTQSEFEYGWPLAIGSAETPLLEMIQGYATLANGGAQHPLIGIRRISDRHGSIIYEAQNEEQESQATDPRIAYQITSILSDASIRPNEYWQSVLTVPGTQAAAKTGTSNKCLERKGEEDVPANAVTPSTNAPCTKRRPSDLWTLGYTPGLVAGIWVGNADSSPLAEKAESLTSAAPLWKEFMVKAVKIMPDMKKSFPIPSGIVQPQISLLSGELPTECTPVDQRRGELFLEENAPSKSDPACVTLEVDKVTELLASDECPAEAREEKSFLSPESVLAVRFPQWQQSIIDWAKKASASGSTLPLPLAPTESCTLALTPGRLAKPRLLLTYPQDGAGVSYPSFRPAIDVRTGSYVRSVRYEIDNKLIASANSGSTLEPPLTIPRSISKAGTHALRVTITDRYFNTATAESTFRFVDDASAPTVRILSPLDGVIVISGTSITIEAQAEDSDGGIKTVEFFLEGRLLTRKPKEPYSFEYTADLKPGTYELTVKAIDFAGNEGEDGVTIVVGE